MLIYYISHDQRYRSYVRVWAEEYGHEVGFPEDPGEARDGECEGILIDLNHLSSDWLGVLASWLETDRNGKCPIGVHGDPSDVNAFIYAFRGAQLTVCERLSWEFLVAAFGNAKATDLE
jgi:hypothetical protein